MLHLYNSGFEPICGITVAISPTENMEIEQLWTLQQTEDDSDVYEVQWADHVSPDNPRHVPSPPPSIPHWMWR